jgi:N-methylhydantoinase A
VSPVRPVGESARSVVSYIIGVDIGGTFTDVVITSSDGQRTTGKSETDRANLVGSVLEAVGNAAEPLGLALDQVLPRTEELVLGSTIGTNFLVESRLPSIGLVTTAGFEDTIRIMRGSLGRTAGRLMEDLADPQKLHKPRPHLIPPAHIVGIRERVDRSGAEIQPLDENAVRSAAARFRELGVTSVAVCFLWSTADAEHERLALSILREELPDVFVTASHELSNRVGEYERTVVTVVNALLGPPNAVVTGDLSDRLGSLGLTNSPMFLNCSGGVVSQSLAVRLPVLLVDSGPAGGVAASAATAKSLGMEHLILGDLGGTTFDVGLVWHGSPLLQTEHVVGGHTMYLPRADVTSIGAGGGSVAWIDRRAGAPRLRVGPVSAGAFPGPLCYRRGGEAPTVTDANLVLGYIDPVDYFGPGTGSLDVEAAYEGLAKLGAELGLDAVGLAAAIVNIVDQHSADLIRQVTVARGLDPALFAMLMYGGSGPLHAGGIAHALRISEVIVPGSLAPVWSALGAASADKVRVLEATVHQRSPWDLPALNRVLAQLAEQGRAEYSATADVTLRFAAALGYSGQVHTIELPMPEDVARSGLTASTSDELIREFFGWYDERYGHGFSLRDRPVEIRHVRCLAVEPRRGYELTAASESTAESSRNRRAWWGGAAGGFLDTPVMRATSLQVGERVAGPALVELARSVLLVHPGQSAVRTEDDFLRLETGIARASEG